MWKRLVLLLGLVGLAVLMGCTREVREKEVHHEVTTETVVSEEIVVE